jgi:hypothetical protein
MPEYRVKRFILMWILWLPVKNSLHKFEICCTSQVSITLLVRFTASGTSTIKLACTWISCAAGLADQDAAVLLLYHAADELTGCSPWRWRGRWHILPMSRAVEEGAFCFARWRLSALSHGREGGCNGARSWRSPAMRLLCFQEKKGSEALCSHVT